MGPVPCTVKVGKKKSRAVESSTWPLNSHNCSENYTKTKTNKNRTSNTHRAELIENAQMVDPIKGCTEKVNLHDPSLLPTLQCTLQCMGHAQKCTTGTQQNPVCPKPSLGQADWVVGSTPMRSINRSRRTDTRRSNTLDNTDVMEIGR